MAGVAAITALREGGTNIADRLGYQSEAPFSRAFKRITGCNPGAVRNGSTSNGNDAEPAEASP